jgi:hypothetical protein
VTAASATAITAHALRLEANTTTHTIRSSFIGDGYGRGHQQVMVEVFILSSSPRAQTSAVSSSPDFYSCEDLTALLLFIH